MNDQGCRFCVFSLLRLILLTVILVRLGVNVVSGEGYNWDFVNFYNAGSRVYYGERQNLYRTTAPIAGISPLGSPRFEYTGFPLSAVFLAPLGAFRPRWALFVFKFASAVFFALGLYLLYQRFGIFFSTGWPAELSLWLYLLMILLFEPFWLVFVVGGQTTSLAFLLWVSFLLAYTAGRPWLAAFFFSLAVVTKPFLGLSAGIFLVARDWRLLRRISTFALVEAILSWWFFGWQAHIDWLQILSKEGSRWAVPWWNNSGMLGLVGNFWLYSGQEKYGLLPVPGSLLGWQMAFKIAVVIIFVWLVNDVRQTSLPSSAKRSYYTILAMLFPVCFSTVVWPHYLALLFILLVFLVGQYRWYPWYVNALTGLIFLCTVRANLWLVNTLGNGVDS